MEIRDIIHGSIEIEAKELPILDSRIFQRLRQIKQLGFAEHSFPTASHSRYIHSLGALSVASRMIDSIAKNARLPIKLVERLKPLARLAALLHDVGHGPLSHTIEFSMPSVSKLNLPFKVKERQATHEDYSLKMILDSQLTPLLDQAGRAHGFSSKHIASLIDSEYELSSSDEDFFNEKILGEKVSFRPLLSQIVSSELDCDRMDYLRRDSLMCGVSYGQFDFEWLVSNLTTHVEKNKSYLALQHRALLSFEDFLISRFHMFLMIYYHYKSAVYDSMLKQYLKSKDCDYVLPGNIDEYIECDDAHLHAHLSKHKNEWAKRISDKKPYRLFVELQSGIPPTKTAEEQQTKLLAKIKKDLDSQSVHYLETTSTGELSKYAGKKKNPIFVRYDNHYSTPAMIPLEDCTDLFQRFEKKRSISRIYVSPEELPRLRQKGRDVPLFYHEQL